MSEQHPEYHKILNIFKRDSSGKRLLTGEWSAEEFNYLKDLPWQITEKIDGTNVRVMWDGASMSFNGKSDNAQMPGPLMQTLIAQFSNLPMLDLFNEKFGDDPVTIYGEGFGGSIQKGGATYGPEQRFVAFDIRVGDWWLRRKDFNELTRSLAIPVVPEIGVMTLTEAAELASRGFDSAYGPFPAEGVIARPETELRARNGERIIVKIKTRDFVQDAIGALSSLFRHQRLPIGEL